MNFMHADHIVLDLFVLPWRCPYAERQVLDILTLRVGHCTPKCPHNRQKADIWSIRVSDSSGTASLPMS
jgi:hypothetical protein